mmetsp:Transcript_46617/g.108832  ORF Transcript_46617/g.108832 Transcript_46617/m.108832 type:complete len:363 (+) Transcript_46617:42-1130(+)
MLPISRLSKGTVLGGKVRCMLILIRHGYSDYNAQNRFTGWFDCDLTNKGREEARVAGSMLRAAGVNRIEKVYSSLLRRAIKTAWLMLDELELQWTPIVYDWRLNERHYGALQGRPKKECVEEFGVKQVQMWRRGIHARPPPWDIAAEMSTVDRRYLGVPVPRAESLSDCSARLRPFLQEELLPAMRAAIEREASASGREAEVPVFVVSSSENLLRALVAQLESLGPEKIPLLDIPYATPLVVGFDADLELVPTALAAAPLRCCWYMGDAERIRDVQADIRAQVSPLYGQPTQAAKAAATAVVAAEVAKAAKAPALAGDDTCFVTVGEETVWVCSEDAEPPSDLSSPPLELPRRPTPSDERRS